MIQALSFLSNLSSDFREFDLFCFTRITNSTAMVLHIFALAAFSSNNFRESCEPAWSDQAFKLVWCDCEAPFLLNSELLLSVYLILFLKHHQEYFCIDCIVTSRESCEAAWCDRIEALSFLSNTSSGLVRRSCQKESCCHPTCSHSQNVTPDLSSSACHQSEKGTFSQRHTASRLSTVYYVVSMYLYIYL